MAGSLQKGGAAFWRAVTAGLPLYWQPFVLLCTRRDETGAETAL